MRDRLHFSAARGSQLSTARQCTGGYLLTGCTALRGITAAMEKVLVSKQSQFKQKHCTLNVIWFVHGSWAPFLGITCFWELESAVAARIMWPLVVITSVKALRAEVGPVRAHEARNEQFFF